MPAAALIVAAVATVAATTTSIIGGNQSRAAARHANDLTQEAAAQQRAVNAEDQANAARQQYRQDRIQRARILQSSSNSGGAYGSGEIGALGSLQTQYNVNQGTSQGRYEANENIGNLQSEANQSIFDAQQKQGSLNSIGSIFQGVGSIAGAYYNASAKSAKIPGATPQATSG